MTCPNNPKPRYPWQSPPRDPRPWGIPPVEEDPWHVPGGPRDVTPPTRKFPGDHPMPPLPGVWGARMPAFETYRPWASQPNGVVGQAYQMTLADVVIAYTQNWDMPDQSTATHAQMVESRKVAPRYVMKRIWDADDFCGRVFGPFPVWTTPEGETPSPDFMPMPWADFLDMMGVPVDGIADSHPTNADAHRQWLAQRIMERYWLREVRGETAAQFSTFLRRHLMESMHAINPVFASLENLDPSKLRDDTDSRYVSDTVDDSKTQQNSKTDTSTTSIASTNPLQSKVLHAESDYYDTGSKTDSTSVTDASGTANATGNQQTRTTGYANRSLSETMTEWVRGVNNALYLVFAEVEPCFSQVWTDNSNMLY